MRTWFQGAAIGAIPTIGYGLWRFGADVDTVGVALAMLAAAVVPVGLWMQHTSRQHL